VAASDARRRTLRVMGWVTAAWVLTVLVIAVLIRVHAWGSGTAGFAVIAGILAGPVLMCTHYGWASNGTLHTGEDRHLVSARTITGTRTVDLNALVSVRRLESLTRNGVVDEFRLRDRHGIRLGVGNGRANEALQQAVQRSTDSVKTTKHARRGLGLAPRSGLATFGYRSWSYVIVLSSVVLPAALSYLATSALAGIRVF
jgi:hypothetical protein